MKQTSTGQLKTQFKRIVYSMGLAAILLIGTAAYGQAPQAIPYQAIARNNSGSTIANQNIALRLSIHDITATGTVVYQETQTATTNALGLFTLHIGQGTSVIGTLAAINWANAAKFIQVELDPAGGTSYSDMGTTQLMSVPYALHAGTAVETDPKVGALTSNKVPKWNGIELENGAITDNGTSVDVNVASFNYLNVYSYGGGLRVANGDREAVITNNGGPTYDTRLSLTNPKGSISLTSPQFYGNDTSSLSTTGDLWLKNDVTGITNLAIKKNGNVGIGTTNPNAALHVQANNAAQEAVIRLEANGGSPLSMSHINQQGSFEWSRIQTTVYSGGNTDMYFKLRSKGSLGVFNRMTFDQYENTSFHTKNIERMRIDSLGKVGIGTTTPASLLTVGNVTGAVTTPTAITMDNSYYLGAASDKLKLYLFRNGTESYGLGLGSAGDVQYWAGTSATGIHRFFTSAQERMRIDASGNVGIGTNTPGELLTIHSNGTHATTSISANGGGNLNLRSYNNSSWPANLNGGSAIFANAGNLNIGTATGSNIHLYTNNNFSSPTMTINNAGGVGIGFGGYSNRLLAVKQSMANGYVCSMENSANTTTAGLITLWGGHSSGSGGNLMQFVNYTTATEYGRISFIPSGVSYVTSSDMRLKKNIVNTKTGLEVLKKISVKDYEFNDRAHGLVVQGILAQELYNVYPEAVSPGTDEVDEKGKLVSPWGIDYGKLTPILIQSVQEQQTQIELQAQQLQVKDKRLDELQQQINELKLLMKK